MQYGDIMLTTNDIAAIMQGTPLKRTKFVSAACKNRDIVSFKEPTGRGSIEHWSRWEIPSDSFAYYLRSKPKYEAAFVAYFEQNIDNWKENNPVMFKIATIIKNTLNRINDEEPDMFTISDISKILNVPSNQVEAIFFARSPIGRAKAKIRGLINMGSLVKYMREVPGAQSYIYDKWEQLARDKDPLESKVRHALMLYAYQFQTENPS